MSPEDFAVTAGGGALGVVAIYLSKIVLTLVKQRVEPRSGKSSESSTMPRPKMISIEDHSLLRDVYSEIEHSKKDREEMIKLLKKIDGKLGDLHEWHDTRDEDGAFRWWNKLSVERSIKRVERMLEQITKRSHHSGEYSLVQQPRRRKKSTDEDSGDGS